MVDELVGEVGKDDVSELIGLEVMAVDLVGRPANRRPWLLLKSDDELPEEVVDALLKEENLDEAGQKVRDAFRKQFPTPDIPLLSSPADGYVDVVYPDRIILSVAGDQFSIGYSIDANGNLVFQPQPEWQKVKREVNYVAAKGESPDNGMPVDETEKSESEGGEGDMSEEELKKAIEKVAELEKAVKDAEDATAEALKKTAVAEAIIKGQRKDARKRELESLCKSAGLDFETVYKAEETDADGAKVFMDAIDKLVKQVDAALGNESGSARKSDVSPREKLTELTKAYALEHPDVPFNKAAEIVRKAHPDLVKEA